MRTLARKSEEIQRETEVGAQRPGRSRAGKHSSTSAALALQRSPAPTVSPNDKESAPYSFNRLLVSLPRSTSMQTKLALSTPGDVYEQEADRIAERVTASTGTKVHRKCGCGGTCDNCRAGQEAEPHEQLQTKSVGPATSTRSEVPAVVHEVLAASGNPLDRATRSDMESSFGHDFGDVRVHTGAAAADSARAVSSLAYTVGHDVVFGTGRYAPSTVAGRRLLAHELTHVVQQDASPALRGAALQRYSHEDCTEDDLRNHVWPADYIARSKVAKAIAAVTESPVSTTTADLFEKYFMTRTPDVTAIAKVFRKLKAAFDGNDYTYECEDDCDAGENAYSGWAWAIHLCMNNIRGRANDCIARTIIHEFSHKFSGTGHGYLFGTASCYNGCNTAGCPSDLTASQALDNAYSYAGFAHEL